MSEKKYENPIMTPEWFEYLTSVDVVPRIIDPPKRASNDIPLSAPEQSSAPPVPESDAMRDAMTSLEGALQLFEEAHKLLEDAKFYLKKAKSNG